ncbi:MAG TPA: tetratricopeptide repeat protein [Solimonas sp.]|nr:tetratricopeptide repeat protein [Solimonas sp.]
MSLPARAAAAVAACLLAAACSLPQRVGEPRDFSLTAPRAAAPQGSDAQAADELYSDLIGRMLAQKQYYAALAHTQEQQQKTGGSDELTWLEAEARRSLGQEAAAEKLYRSLLRTSWAGRAYHGLGLLYARRDLGQSVELLRQAVRREPTDVSARNDLGYALMMAGRYTEALPELATAVELDPRGDKARNNLIVLLLASRDEAGARKVAEQAGVDKQTLAGLRQQAQSLMRSPAAAAAGKRGGR